MQNVHFSPPDLAPLFDVNVSTIKRWIDQGLLSAEVTPGGHRRVTRQQLQDFLQRSPHLARRSYVLKRLMHPPAKTPYWTTYYQLLHRGRDIAAREYLEQTYIRTRDVAMLIDTVIAPALVHIGQGWRLGTLDIIDEHRMSFLIRSHLLMLDTLTAGTPRPRRRALLACVRGEQHEISTQMLTIVLHHHGWTADSLGINTPAKEIIREIHKHPPQLVGLAKSYSVIPSNHYLAAVTKAAQVKKTVVCFGGAGWPMKLRTTSTAQFIPSLKVFEDVLKRFER